MHAACGTSAGRGVFDSWARPDGNAYAIEIADIARCTELHAVGHVAAVLRYYAKNMDVTLRPRGQRFNLDQRRRGAGAGASPGSPINRASSDPQKRDDVVKGEGRSRRGAKAEAALGSSWALE
ncbi:hypothetical protein ALC60_11355 [Trachymyrmex zeteki]|uniref:Uncharacterized protein n=1 Tax=Mycetomoellerius zeteki TaxID=64791 RepID=A0A151WP47_9HYME|nr:hypothetical protein ALC60_11355 [Trachymyrmex zeteki]